MYHDLLANAVEFKTPWEGETLPHRMRELLSGKGERVAFLYGTPDTSTFRYRVYNIVEALRASPDCELRASWFAEAEIEALRAILPRLSTLVLARLRISRAVSDLIATAKAFGVQVLLDCDDLVFDLRYAQLVSVNIGNPTDIESALDSWYAYIGRLNATAQLCDGGITTNRFLAEKLENVCNGPVSVIQNFLNYRQEELSRRLLAIKAKRDFRGNGRVMIGYFSGSPTHNNDFRAALGSIIQLMDEDSGIDIRIVGFMDCHNELNRFGARVDMIPLQDWLNLQVKIAEVDINIAPLQLNDFTHCKSELKYFEAAVVGTYTIATRSHTFEHAINDPRDGTLVENGEWYEALQSATSLVRDPVRYAPLAIHTAERAYQRYGSDRNIEAIKAALQR
jgi:hypothetical protein